MPPSDEPKKAEDRDPLPFATPLQPEPKIDLGPTPTESQQRVMMASFSAEMYSGPIPPPLIMGEWEKLLPGSADRILKMAEKQSAHRIAVETKVIDSDVLRSNRGLWFGLIIALVLIIGGVITILFGHDWAGTAIITSNLVGVVGAFIYAHIARENERNKRMNAAGAVGQIAIPTPPKSPKS